MGLGLPRSGARSKPVLSQTKHFEIVNKMYTTRKLLKFGVSGFLNYENRFTGSKAMTKKLQKMTIFWKMPNF